VWSFYIINYENLTKLIFFYIKQDMYINQYLHFWKRYLYAVTDYVNFLHSIIVKTFQVTQNFIGIYPITFK